MTDKKKIEIIIDGRNFTVVGGDNEEYVRNLGYYVDKKIRELASKNERLSQTMAATLAALNIADELYKTKDQLEGLENKAKDPLEKYDTLCGEFEEAKEKIQELKQKNKDIEEELSKVQSQEQRLLKEIKKLNEEKESQEKEIEESREQIKILQDKNFQNQIELVEVKKELTEYIRILDNETSTFTKEGK